MLKCIVHQWQAQSAQQFLVRQPSALPPQLCPARNLGSSHPGDGLGEERGALLRGLRLQVGILHRISVRSATLERQGLSNAAVLERTCYCDDTPPVLKRTHTPLTGPDRGAVWVLLRDFSQPPARGATLEVLGLKLHVGRSLPSLAA